MPVTRWRHEIIPAGWVVLAPDFLRQADVTIYWAVRHQEGRFPDPPGVFRNWGGGKL